MTTILQDFLSAGLLPIGDDDAKLKNLEDAAEALAGKLQESPLLAYRFALVGLDCEVPATDPVHGMASVAIKEKWLTIANKVGADPIQLYRGVILRALQIAAEKNTKIQFSLAIVSANIRPGSISGPEQVPVTSFLSTFKDSASQLVQDAWASIPDMSLARLATKVKKLQINKEDLTNALGKAVGPKGKDGQPNNGNPHWSNTPEPWSLEFASRAAEAIATALQTSSKVHVEDIQEALRESLAGFVENIQKLAIRDAKSDLLWIQASQYSPSGQNGYKQMSDEDLLLYAILDISRAVNEFAPTSVEHFLANIVSSAKDDSVECRAVLQSLASKLSSVPEADLVRTDTLPAIGRRSMLDIAIRQNSVEDFKTQSGFAEDYKEKLPLMAVRLYREVQIYKLLRS